MKSILFNTEMVQAILSGNKTQTRRVKKSDNQPYKVGDILYVRETWNINNIYKETSDEELYYIVFKYKADDSLNKVSVSKDFYYKYKNTMVENNPEWKPSIHMPKEAARIFLKVKDIRVERLQDIDDEGVVAEGLKIGDPFDDVWNNTIPKKSSQFNWENNPFVWVIEFENIKESNK